MVCFSVNVSFHSLVFYHTCWRVVSFGSVEQVILKSRDPTLDRIFCLESLGEWIPALEGGRDALLLVSVRTVRTLNVRGGGGIEVVRTDGLYGHYGQLGEVVTGQR